MNKAAIKNFAIRARNKLITDIQYRAGLMGITAEGIKNALPQSTSNMEFYDIGTAEPYSITGEAIWQRQKLVEILRQKEKDSGYSTAYKYILEEVAYTWFNRLIAIRFMEVNDYLPSHIRVLSSETGRVEPDLVTTPFDAELDFTPAEKEAILRLKTDNALDELFRLLFIKQCNALNEIIPALFEKTSDYTELLLNLSVVDQDGVVYHLIHDIDENDFNIEKGGQVEIIGWLYQYYNTEPKNAAFAKNGKITKDEIPAVTQLFTPDWIVRYMVQNSLGRLFIDKRKNEGVFADGRGLDEMTWDEAEEKRIAAEKHLAEQMEWNYYLPEAAQTKEVREQLDKIQQQSKYKDVRDIKVIDPCMGSGHILVYAFDVLMQMYEDAGYSQRDAAKSILANNLYGLDIDDRAYQLAYFAVMMKARQYNRRILNGKTTCHVYAIQESNNINRIHLKYLGAGMEDLEVNTARVQMEGLLDTLRDAKEYGSILKVESYNWELLRRFVSAADTAEQITLDSAGLEVTAEQLLTIIDIAEAMARKYDVVVTNPPYMGNGGFTDKLTNYAKRCYENSKNDLYSIMIERCINFLDAKGYSAMITMQSWLNAPTFKKLRFSLFKSIDFVSINNMGSRAFEEIQGEKVKNVTFVIARHNINDWKPVFVDLTGVQGEVAKRQLYLSGKNRYDFAKQSDFVKHEQCLVVYKSRHVDDIYSPEKRICDECEVRRCIATGEDDTFIRLWTEVDSTRICDPASRQTAKKWFFIASGGEHRMWYGNMTNILNWENDGIALREFNERTHKSTLRNVQYMFKEGITYTYTSMGSGTFNARFLPRGMASIGVGPVLVECNNTLYTLGYVNSVAFRWFWDTMYGKVSTFETGNVGRIAMKYKNEEQVISIVDKNITMSKEDWDSFETSWDFKRHPLV